VADFRLRIGFAKTGAAIWLSHLEVVRAMERCVRRSGLPAAISQGFSPHMKHSFSSALPVGTGSTGEYMDVELLSPVAPEQALQALQAVQHPCLPVLSTEYAQKDEPSLQVFFNLSTYLIELADPGDTLVADPGDTLIKDPGDTLIKDPGTTLVSELCQRLSARPEITITKKGKPKSYDLSLYVTDVAEVAKEAEATEGAEEAEEAEEAEVEKKAEVEKEAGEADAAEVEKEAEGAGSSLLTLSLLSLPEGSLRPEVILRAIATATAPPLEAKITTITRIALEHQELAT